MPRPLHPCGGRAHPTDLGHKRLALASFPHWDKSMIDPDHDPPCPTPGGESQNSPQKPAGADPGKGSASGGEEVDLPTIKWLGPSDVPQFTAPSDEKFDSQNWLAGSFSSEHLPQSFGHY